MALCGATAAQATDGILLFETFNSGTFGWTTQHIDFAGGWRNDIGNPGGAFILNDAGDPNSDPSISRTLDGLRLGVLYMIEGDFKDFHNSCPQPMQTSFRVDLNGTTVYSSARATQWTRFQAEWIADSTQVTIRLRAETDGSDCDAVVDNIRFREVFPCPGDVTDNNVVDAVDLSVVLSAWGTNGQGQFMADVNGDGTVDGTDLAFVLGGWGPCP